MMPWQQLRHLLKPFSGRLALVLLLILASSSLAVLLPWPMKLILDHVIADEPLPQTLQFAQPLFTLDSGGTALVLLVLGSVILLIINQVLGFLQSWLETDIGEGLSYDMGEQLLHHLQSLSLAYHQNQNNGDLVRRVTTDSRCLQQLVLGVGSPLVAALFSLTLMLTIMLQMHPLMTLVAICAALPIPALIRALAPQMTKYTYQHQQSEGQLMSVAEQTLTGMPVIQAFSQERHQSWHFRRLSENTMSAYLLAIKAQLKFGVGVSSTMAIGTSIMIVVGGISVLNGGLTIGELSVFLAYLAALYGPMETIAHLSTTYAASAARVQRVQEVLSVAPVIVDHPEALSVTPEQTASSREVLITIDDLHFEYKCDEPVLTGVNLEIQAGQTVALVGSTGSGKSTLAALVCRLYDPTSGVIRLAGQDLRDISIESLRNHIAMLLQEPFLLPVSIFENIRYGRPDASREEVVRAARAANAEEFITRLPDGYDTILSEQANDLSGGQRQRLAIARTLLKDAPILILDEPTSALDTTTEGLFVDALKLLMKDRTTIIIAHRLSTIREADLIVVMDAGQIVEVGGYEELAQRGGFFAELLGHGKAA